MQNLCQLLWCKHTLLHNVLSFSFREFDLKLVPDHSIFSPDFQAVLKRDNEEIVIPLDKDSFMSGYVEGMGIHFE